MSITPEYAHGYEAAPHPARAGADGRVTAEFPGFPANGTPSIPSRVLVELDDAMAVRTHAVERPLTIFMRDGVENRCSADRCRIFVHTTKIEVSAAAGTRITMGEHTVTAPAEGAAEIPFDLGPALATADLAAMIEDVHYSVDVPNSQMTLIFSDGRAATGTLSAGSVTLREALLAALERVAEGPVPFAEEGSGHGLVYAARGPTNTPVLRVIGSVARVGDIGRVALVRTEGRASGNCGTYQNDRGVRTTIDRRAIDATVTIYDRRTGEQLQQRSFRGRAPSCPEVTAGFQVVQGSADRAAIDRWLDGLPRARGARGRQRSRLAGRRTIG